jgi:hypothetical protein
LAIDYDDDDDDDDDDDGDGGDAQMASLSIIHSMLCAGFEPKTSLASGQMDSSLFWAWVSSSDFAFSRAPFTLDFLRHTPDTCTSIYPSIYLLLRSAWTFRVQTSQKRLFQVALSLPFESVCTQEDRIRGRLRIKEHVKNKGFRV